MLRCSCLLVRLASLPIAQLPSVMTGTYGEYINTTEFRPLSGLGKTGKGGYEERDPYKLKDKQGRNVYCFKCHEPANPLRQKRILACDHCELHWHLDCLDPPLVGLPPVTRKWKCPIHADMVIVRGVSDTMKTCSCLQLICSGSRRAFAHPSGC